MDKEIKLYEGNEPYIFVSYCHRDKRRVLPILETLSMQGYRLWYDKGIHPCDEWPEVVAEHLLESAVFIAFISDEYIESKNCMIEIKFAHTKEKNILTIYLEDADLPASLEMFLCTLQAIKYQEYNDKSEFYKELVTVKKLNSCRRTKSKISGFNGEYVPEETAENESSNAKTRKKKRILIFFFLGCIIAGIYIFKDVRIGSEKFGRFDVFISIENQNISSDVMKKINRFPILRILQFKNCVFDEDVINHFSKLDITQLSFENCEGVKDYSFLKELDSLKILTINECGLTNESFESVYNEGLICIEISGNPKFSDISGFKNQMPSLREIELADNNIKNVDVLSEYEDLTYLCLDNNQIETISVPMKSTQIYFLYVSDNPLRDISGCSDLSELMYFKCRNTELAAYDTTGLMCIKESADTLLRVDLSYNNYEQAVLESLFSECTHMKRLALNGNRLNDLSFLANAINLEVLSVSGCGLTSIAGIENLENLSKLDLSDNQLKSVKYLPKFGEKSIISLDISDNQITSIDEISSYAYYKYLLLYGNPLEAEVLDDLWDLSGDCLGMTYLEELQAHHVRHFGECYFEDVPKDKRWDYEETIDNCNFGVIENNIRL